MISRISVLIIVAVMSARGQLTNVGINDDFTTGVTTGTFVKDSGLFTEDGWEITDSNSQIMWDLGKTYQKGIVEFDIKGNLEVTGSNEFGPIKKVIFAAWNEEEALDPRPRADDDTTGFFQIRCISESKMMLRLTHRLDGAGSAELWTREINWVQDQWYHIKGVWDTDDGINELYLDGELLASGKFNKVFEGLRYIFIGADNYDYWGAIVGNTYANLQVYGLEPDFEPTNTAAAGGISKSRAQICFRLPQGQVVSVPCSEAVESASIYTLAGELIARQQGMQSTPQGSVVAWKEDLHLSRGGYVLMVSGRSYEYAKTFIIH